MNKYILPILASSCAMSQAAIIMLSDPAGATASSFFAGAGGFPVTNLYDGTITAADVGTTNNQGAANGYAGNGAGPHYVIYDMGSAQDIGGFYFANRPGNGTDTTDQILNIEFYFSYGSTDATEATASAYTDANTADFTQVTTDSNYQNLAAYDFGSNTNTQFVLMKLTGDGNFNPGGQELMLASHVPIPEPSSTALLGLGGLALILRRRK